MNKNRFQRISLVILMSVSAMHFVGFKWDETNLDFKTPSKSNSAAKANENEETEVQSARQLTQAEIDEMNLPKIPQVASLPHLPKLPQVPDIPKIATVQNTPSMTDPNISKAQDSGLSTVPVIQSRIKELIEVNEQLKPQLKSQAFELQRISEQARFHKRILQDLERAKQSKAAAVPTDTQELVRQEKIRLISQETQTNYQYVKDLKNIKNEPEDLR